MEGVLIRVALSVEANEFLYLRCYQYVLHGQVKSLINLGLPMDLEVAHPTKPKLT